MRALALVLVLGVAAALADGCRKASAADVEESKVADAWFKRRIERLTAPAGWLSLAGLVWLKEGANELTLPGQSAPVGTITVSGKAARFAPAAGANVQIDGQPAREAELQTDAKPKPTLLTSGTFTFFVIERGDKLAVRIRDTEAKARREFRGIDRFAPQAKYRVTGRFEPFAKPEQVPVPTILGTIDPMPSPGLVRFTLEGQELALKPVYEGDDPRFFFVFADATSGKSTYGAGRFLYAEPPKDGQVVLDFNQAYNPPCAFSPWATCPLPPEGNRLALAIEAGEKAYAHH